MTPVNILDLDSDNPRLYKLHIQNPRKILNRVISIRINFYYIWVLLENIQNVNSKKTFMINRYEIKLTFAQSIGL